MSYLDSSFFVIRVVAAVGDNQVIHKPDTHHATGLLYASRQLIISHTGLQTARRVIMTDGQDGSVAEHGFAHQDAYIDAHLADAPMCNA
jgi:hypothetical protein